MTHWQRLQKDGYITLKVFEPKQRAQLRKELQCIVAASNKYKRMVDKGLVMRSFRASFHKPWIRKIRKILNPILLHQCNIPHWTVPDTCIRAWVNFEPTHSYAGVIIAWTPINKHLTSTTMEVHIGDVIEIKRVITVVDINREEKQIKITWKDKVGKQREQWVTYKMFKLL